MVQVGNVAQKESKDDDVESQCLQETDSSLPRTVEADSKRELLFWGINNFVVAVVSVITAALLCVRCRHGVEQETIAVFWIIAMQLVVTMVSFVAACTNKSGGSCCIGLRCIRVAAWGVILISICGIIGFIQLTVDYTYDIGSCGNFARVLMLVQSVFSITLNLMGFAVIRICL